MLAAMTQRILESLLQIPVPHLDHLAGKLQNIENSEVGLVDEQIMKAERFLFQPLVFSHHHSEPSSSISHNFLPLQTLPAAILQSLELGFNIVCAVPVVGETLESHKANSGTHEEAKRKVWDAVSDIYMYLC